MAEHPDPVDVFVGNTVRAMRLRSEVSQQRLAMACGITFQQIQKYETGANRVSASMLSRIARHLNAPVEAFFPPVDPNGVVAGLGPAERLAAAAGGLELARHFLAIPVAARASLVRVAANMADAFGQEPGVDYVTGGEREDRRHVA